MNTNYASLLESVEILSNHHVERFKQLRDNEQYKDADSVASEYICDEVEDDNYQWCYAKYQFKEAN